jgi:hypothetical protein
VSSQYPRTRPEANDRPAPDPKHQFSTRPRGNRASYIVPARQLSRFRSR